MLPATLLVLTACNPFFPGTDYGQLPNVDLTFTGPVSGVVQGHDGECGTRQFDAFGFSGGSPGLGLFTAVEKTPGLLTLTLEAGTSTFTVAGIADAFSLSDKRRTMTVDVDLMGEAGTEHVRGTISCPFSSTE